MNNKQIAKKNMYDKMLLFFTTNGTIWATFLPLVAAIARFVTKRENLQTYMTKQAQPTEGLTTDKTGKRSKAVEILVKFARKGRAWAHDTGNTVLEGLFNVRVDDFYELSDTEALTLLRIVWTGLDANVGSMGDYNVTAGDVGDIKDAIDAFDAVKEAAGVLDGVKVSGTEGIEELTHKLDEELDVIDDLFVSEYETSHPGKVAEYKSDRKMHTVGLHHTRLNVHVVYSDGSGNAEGVVMHVVGPDKTAVSDIDGNIAGPNMKPGTYHVLFSGEEIQTKAIIQKVKRGQTVHLEIEVVKGVSTGSISGHVQTNMPGNPPATIALVGTGQSTTTDGLGNFVFIGVAPGNPTVQCFLMSDPANIKTATPTVVAGGNVVVNFMFP